MSDWPSRCIANIAVAVAIAACGTPLQPPKSDPSLVSDRPPQLRAGSPIQLDSVRAAGAVAAVAAGPDELRVLYERQRSGEIRYVVLTAASGIKSNEALPSRLVPDRGMLHGHFDMDLAFDSESVLHALVGGRHLALRSDGWTGESGPPCVAFVRGGPRLVCVGPPPADYPAKHRWDWTFMGPITYPLPIFIPSRTTLRTLAAYVHQPDGWHVQGVFDAASEGATLGFRAVVASNGDVHAVFERTRKYGSDWRYELVTGMADPAPRGASAPSTLHSRPIEDPTKDANCVPPARSLEFGFRWPLASLAIDGSRGSGIVAVVADRGKLVCQRTIGQGTLGDPLVAFAGQQFRGVWVSYLGDERWAMLLADQDTVATTETERGQFSLAVFGAGRWSTAEPVGMFNWAASFGGDAPLISRGDGRAALVALDWEARPVVVWFEPRP